MTGQKIIAGRSTETVVDWATRKARDIMGHSDDDEEAAIFIAQALRDERKRAVKYCKIAPIAVIGHMDRKDVDLWMRGVADAMRDIATAIRDSK